MQARPPLRRATSYAGASNGVTATNYDTFVPQKASDQSKREADLVPVGRNCAQGGPDCPCICCRRSRSAAPTPRRAPREPTPAAAASLPTGTDKASQAARRKIFETWDCNCNGYLSLAEIDRGLLADGIAAPKPVVLRAFQAARGAVASKNARGEDYVEMGKEFRLLLLFLRQYAELFSAFQSVDTDGDRRIDLDELKAATTKLKALGLDVNTRGAQAEFAAMDTDGKGLVLFDEFAHWCLKQRAAAEKKEDELLARHMRPGARLPAAAYVEVKKPEGLNAEHRQTTLLAEATVSAPAAEKPAAGIAKRVTEAAAILRRLRPPEAPAGEEAPASPIKPGSPGRGAQLREAMKDAETPAAQLRRVAAAAAALLKECDAIASGGGGRADDPRRQTAAWMDAEAATKNAAATARHVARQTRAELYVRRKALFDVSTRLEQSVTALSVLRDLGDADDAEAVARLEGMPEEEHEWWEEEDEALITSVCARGTFGSWFRVAAAVREARSQLKSERTEAQCRRRWARAAAEVVGEAERRAQFAVMSEDLAATAVANWGPQIVKCSRELKEERRKLAIAWNRGGAVRKGAVKGAARHAELGPGYGFT